MSTHTIRLVLNGSRQEHEVPAELLLIDLLAHIRHPFHRCSPGRAMAP